MEPIYIWLIGYVLPAFATSAALRIAAKYRGRPKLLNSAIVHTGLLISISISHYFIYKSGLDFPWQPSELSLAACILSLAAMAMLIGQTGIWYSLSAFIQELTMLSIAFLLLPTLPLYLVTLMIVSMFVLGHTMRTSFWKLRVILFAAWGVIAISFFSAGVDIYLISALHAILGTALISRKILLQSDS